MSSLALKQAATGQAATPARTILDYLEHPRVAKGIAAVGGKFMTPERMLSLCINAVKKTPRLMQCDPQSVLGAMMASAALGLEPNTVQQQAFLIPYKKRVKNGNNWEDAFECQFQVGYRGFITLGYRSPHIARFTANAIHHGDHWKHMDGSKAFLEWSMNLAERGALIGAYSHVELTSGRELACVLPLAEVMKIRSKSETFRTLSAAVEAAENAKDRTKAEGKLADTPWVMWEDDMAAKSAIKKHSKMLPIAVGDSLASAAAMDDHGDAGTLDLAALSDPDAVRDVVENGAELPALKDDASPTLATSGEAFGTRERATVVRQEATDANPRQATTVRQQSQSTDRPTGPAPGPDDDDTGAEPARSPATPAFNAAAFEARLLGCQDSDALDLMGDSIRSITNEADRSQLQAVYMRCRENLRNPPQTENKPAAPAPLQPVSRRTARPNTTATD